MKSFQNRLPVPCVFTPRYLVAPFIVSLIFLCAGLILVLLSTFSSIPLVDRGFYLPDNYAYAQEDCIKPEVNEPFGIVSSHDLREVLIVGLSFVLIGLPIFVSHTVLVRLLNRKLSANDENNTRKIYIYLGTIFYGFLAMFLLVMSIMALASYLLINQAYTLSAPPGLWVVCVAIVFPVWIAFVVKLVSIEKLDKFSASEYNNSKSENKPEEKEIII